MNSEASLGRKRQRSASDDVHDTNKRSSPHSTIDDVDAYMQDNNDPDPLPPQKVRIIDDLVKDNTMTLGQTWYLVDSPWVRRWRSACNGEVGKEGPVAENDLGPVATAPLLDDFGNLKPGLMEGIDVEYMPQDAWDKLTSWYGSPEVPIPRHTIARGEQKQIQLELHPPLLRAGRLSPSDFDPSTPPTSISLSTHDTLRNLSERLASAVSPSPPPLPPYRIWKVTNDDFTLAHLDKGEKNLLEASDKTLEEAGIESLDSFAVEFKEDDRWLVDLAPAPIFKSNDGFFNRMSSTVKSPFASKSPSTAVTTPAAKKVNPGTLGLGNLGNTCFMNSAVQCLAHTPEVAEYFLSGVFEQELNPDNPLGMHGQIAQAFAALLHKIWSTTFQSTSSYSSSHSYSPREFKSTLSRFAPQFSGYQQHDSQEFVAFLLDGLHEDLNRILKKPYVENPDWDEERQKRAQNDYAKEILEFARKSWNGYKKRNDSVIVDLFQGQYQSTLICPECEKVSITFDPFMYLTLPLPIQKKWRHSVLYIPWDNEKPHLRIPVELPRADCSLRELRVLLGRWMSVDPDNLLTLEIFNHRFYKNLDDNVMCSEMSDSDVIVCFELPCHSRQSRTYDKLKKKKKKKAKKAEFEVNGKDSEAESRSQSPSGSGSQENREQSKEGEQEEEEDDEPFIVPTFLCDAPPANSGTGSGAFSYTRNNTYNSYSRGPSLFGYPGIVVVPRDKARSMNAIYECVIDRLQRWTKNRRDLWTWEEGGRKKKGSGNGDEEDEEMEEIQIDYRNMGMGKEETITEIKKKEGDGEVVVEEVPVQTQTPPESPRESASAKKEAQPEPDEEGDIADEKSMVLVDDEEDNVAPASSVPVRVGPKKDVFTIRLQKDQKDYAVGGLYGSSNKFDSWDTRTTGEGDGDVLLRECDAFYCEFDENMKAYYFGEERGGGYGGGSFSSGSGGKFEHALWEAEHFEEFIHPEYKEATKSDGEKKPRGISLHDCLAEFTKEEKLGEDDLWYCPRCKKHQQATKRFDLWKVPDVLVVHLKRFSNSRMLRDKIDVFVDFPTENLDLGDMVGERRVLNELVKDGRLKEVIGQEAEGVEEELLQRSQEPLVYDLFAVDEHIGGLGGGHYRAYALNHMDGSWYHFDDSYVTPAKASESVNQNAYLLFYRRRSSNPLGGKSHELVEEAKSRPRSVAEGETLGSNADTLPTPDADAEGDDELNLMTTIQLPTPRSDNLTLSDDLPNYVVNYSWTTPSSENHMGFSDGGDPPAFEDSMHSTLLSDPVDTDIVQLLGQENIHDEYLQSWRDPNSGLADRTGAGSPTSSIEAEPDLDEDLDIGEDSECHSQRTEPSVSGSESAFKLGQRPVSPTLSPSSGPSGAGSPSSSSVTLD
ncbi:hypothetical protein D9758_015091 [Tetrapyrgos nigripes]|uniref:ubiquitinyl hydrolase 1 n=1 Tax=Tetrapyrgos nigripes TaxID=182062 RepID=A0A8H5FH93_9AGAR|nr:hypothetical protein D9758_015091 [Tetrapyrgos nigripes]